MTDAALLRDLARSGLFDPLWYQARYPDVARSGLSAWRHFAAVGFQLGRDPGPGFRAARYLAANPDVAAAGLPALAHYLRSGRAERRALQPLPRAVPRAARLRWLLESGGLDTAPLAELRDLAAGAGEEAALAQEALAFHALRGGDAVVALHLFRQRLGPAPTAALLHRLAPVMGLAAVQAGDPAAAPAVQGDSPDAALARIALAGDDAQRLAGLNEALACDALEPVTAPGRGALIDRLTAPVAVEAEGPKISVIMAAHQAADSISTAVRAVLAQSWRNLELIVADDASGDGTPAAALRAAAGDPRLRLLRAERNRGAYAARNLGLAAATGDFITLHDADDWSHPATLARQMQALRTRPGVLGVMVPQLRCRPDLTPSRFTGEGALAHESTASLLLPARILRDALGGWDEVRVSADGELLRRLRAAFGTGAATVIGTAPVVLKRDHAASATAAGGQDGVAGMDWFYYGARLEYLEAQRHHHATAPHLNRRLDPRPFPVPDALRPERPRRPDRLDVVYAGLMGVHEDGVAALIAALDKDLAEGRRAGLLPLRSTAAPWSDAPTLHPILRSRVDGVALRTLVHGDRAETNRLVWLPGQPRPDPSRHMPEVTAPAHAGDGTVSAPGDLPMPEGIPPGD